MGFKTSEWAYNVPNLTAPERAVLVALAHCRNDKTGACFPAQETLVEMTALSEKTVRRALAALETGNAPLIARTPRFSGRYRTSDSYELLIDDHRSDRPPVTVTTGQPDHRSESPSPPVTVTATTGHSDHPIGTGMGTGMEEGVPLAPTPTCTRHSTWEHEDPCRACGHDREAHAAWVKALDSQWDSLLSAEDAELRRKLVPIRTTMSPRVVDCGSHRWIADGTCMRCEQRKPHEHVGAA